MIYVGIIVAICAAEFWIRRRVNKNFATNENREVGRLPIRLRKYHNEGMANNTLEKKPQFVKGIGIGVVSILTIMFLLAMTLKGKSALKAGLALILGGGLANLLERFRHGYVTDYVQFKVPIPFLKKLIFNIADFCVFIGMAVLMLREIGKQC